MEYDLIMQNFRTIPVEDREARFNEVMSIARRLAIKTGRRQVVLYDRFLDGWEIRPILRNWGS